jgi:hypothetical protein
MIEQLTSAQMSYYSSNWIDESTANHSKMEALYPTEFLNTLLINGLPDHVLHSKIGVTLIQLEDFVMECHTHSVIVAATVHYALHSVLGLVTTSSMMRSS